MNLFLFAHQDDEYGIFPVLEQLVARGEPLAVAYLTSGTPDGRISAQRNAESVRVLTHLGLTPEQIHFPGAELNLPDGQLYQHLQQACVGVLHLLEDGTPPTRIFTPAWEGGHQDHDATHIVACYLAQKFSCLEASRQFPLYHGQGLPGILWHTFLPLTQNGPAESMRIFWRQRWRYLGYCLTYHSQWLTWLGLYPPYALNILTKGEQYLQPLNLDRLRAAPHAGRLLYQRREFCSQEQFVFHTATLIDRITR